MSSSARGRGRGRGQITKRGNNRVEESPDDLVTEDPVITKNTGRDETNGGGNAADSEVTWKKPAVGKVGGAQAERSTAPGQPHVFLSERKSISSLPKIPKLTKQIAAPWESATKQAEAQSDPLLSAKPYVRVQAIMSDGQGPAAFPALAERTDRRGQTADRPIDDNYREMLIEKVLTAEREMNGMQIRLQKASEREMNAIRTMKAFCRAILVECGIEFDESLLESASRGDFESVKRVIAEKREEETYELNRAKQELETLRKTASASDAAEKDTKYALNVARSALQTALQTIIATCGASENETNEYGNRPFSTANATEEQNGSRKILLPSPPASGATWRAPSRFNSGGAFSSGRSYGGPTRGARGAYVPRTSYRAARGSRPRRGGFTPGRGMGGPMRGGFDRNDEDTNPWKRPRVSYADLDEADEPAFEENW